ncbi:uncharacterized protein BJ171DRAFT_485169, partial [Polychytrium aggregatum]|uniref:uncharacterized protein n=1 Tax=Polychytrium aggregatum TaxID=110093 RepID=UPI0022FE1263
MTKNPRFKSVEFRDKSLSSTLPKPLALANVAIRMLLEQSTTCASPYETQSEKQQLSVVGGVLYFDLAEMPDSAKSLGSWCIRPILSSEGSLYRCVYPFKKPIVEGEKEEDASAADLTIWPMHVTYELYPGMFLNTATAKVMAWNPDTELWDDDNITDVEIDIDLGQVKFRTLHFRPTALIQGLYSEFPLQDWLMKPSPTKNRSTLWIRGKENEAEIEIGEGECRFVAPMKPFMEKEFLDKWYPPELLFKKLLHYGLNFRAPKKMKGVDIEDLILKNPDPEEDCLLGISLCQPCFVFRRSSGNRHLPPSKIAFRAHVCSDPKSFDSEDPEVSWWSVVHDSTFTIDEAAKTIAYVTKETEITEDVKFNAEARENMTLHSSVYHTLACMPPEDEASKIEQVSAVWTRTVAEIMKITRLL